MALKLLKKAVKRQSAACTQLYQHPAANEVISAYEPYSLVWDPNCVTEDASVVDVYLYDISGTGRGPVFKFPNIDAQAGSFQTAFVPRWWNATQADSKQLRLQFANQGEPNWASPYATGPVFTVNWNGTVPASAARGDTSNPEPVIDDPGREKALEAGKLVAAILIPLLVAITAIGIYVFWSRKKQATATKRWSQAVDRRMSQISQTWSASRPLSMAASQRSHGHARQASNYSFTGPNASFGSPQATKEHKRQSTVSFAPQISPTRSRNPSANRPHSTASYPKVGANGQRDLLTPLSPEQESPELLASNLTAPCKRHAHQSSLASSLRNEVSLFDEEQLAAAVSVINGDRTLPDRPTSGLSYNTAPSSQSSLAHGDSHVRQPSLVSLTVPRLDRASTMSPDHALAAYASARDGLKVTTHVSTRSLPSSNPFTRRASLAAAPLPSSASNPDLQVSFGQAH